MKSMFVFSLSCAFFLSACGSASDASISGDADASASNIRGGKSADPNAGTTADPNHAKGPECAAPAVFGAANPNHALCIGRGALPIQIKGAFGDHPTITIAGADESNVVKGDLRHAGQSCVNQYVWKLKAATAGVYTVTVTGSNGATFTFQLTLGEAGTCVDTDGSTDGGTDGGTGETPTQPPIFNP